MPRVRHVERDFPSDCRHDPPAECIRSRFGFFYSVGKCRQRPKIDHHRCPLVWRPFEKRVSDINVKIRFGRSGNVYSRPCALVVGRPG